MNESLYRISLKCLIVNELGEVLVVKERGRSYWDLPGGGMDHGESMKVAISRELHEEVGFEGDFSFNVVDVEDATLLNKSVWQGRVILKVRPGHLIFNSGEDADEVRFIDPTLLANSIDALEQKLHTTLMKVL